MSPKEINGERKIAPNGKPIYASNQKELQKKIKNRQSALESRRKNKEKFENLGKIIILKNLKFPQYNVKFTLYQFITATQLCL